MPPVKIRVLGCGSSGGVPLINGEWGACDPAEPKNRRRRPCLLLQCGDTSVLVDAGPDVRSQILNAGLKTLDALIITHDHADHTHGLDDLRFLVQPFKNGPMPVYMTSTTEASLHAKFGYAFEKTAHSALYPALFREHLLAFDSKGLSSFSVGPICFKAWLHPHGPMECLSLRVGDFAYTTDAVNLGDEHFQYLQALETWIVDVVRYKPHISHAHLDMALPWIEKLSPAQTYLTHMSHELDYEALQRVLPEGVAPAYDGLSLEIKIN